MQPFEKVPKLPPHSFPLIWCRREDSKICDEKSKWIRFFVVIHRIYKNRQEFELRSYSDKYFSCMGGSESLEGCLLEACAYFEIPIQAWRLYQPPQGLKLYDRPRSRQQKINRKTRKYFLEMDIYFKYWGKVGRKLPAAPDFYSNKKYWAIALPDAKHQKIDFDEF